MAAPNYMYLRGVYFFTSKIFLKTREEIKATGALSGEYDGCSIK